MATATTKAISVRFPVELLTQLQEQAAADGSTMSAIVVAAVDAHLNPADVPAPAKREPHQLIVRSGNRVTHYTDWAGLTPAPH